MIDTLHLLPPDRGLRANPVLFGIAEAIAELLPLTSPLREHREDGPPETCAVEPTDVPADPAAAN